MRLFISNSNNKFVIVSILIICFLIIFFIECFYIFNNIPVYWGEDRGSLISDSKLSNKPTLFILGDSRAEVGVVSEIIDSNTNYSSYNIGLEGVYKGYYKKLRLNNISADKLIVAVSPYSIFNRFRLNEEDMFERIHNRFMIVIKPNNFTEKILSNIINRNTHLHYGFSAFFEVIEYGKVSEYYTSKGWHGYDRLGSDAYYTYMINLEGYKYKMLEEYKDSIKVNTGKKNFERMLTDIRKNNIPVLFVRIPTSKKIREIEDGKYPWFSSYILETVNKYNYDYIEFNKFIYPTYQVDGSHLNRVSANEFTKELVKFIE